MSKVTNLDGHWIVVAGTLRDMQNPRFGATLSFRHREVKIHGKRRNVIIGCIDRVAWDQRTLRLRTVQMRVNLKGASSWEAFVHTTAGGILEALVERRGAALRSDLTPKFTEPSRVTSPSSTVCSCHFPGVMPTG